MPSGHENLEWPSVGGLGRELRPGHEMLRRVVGPHFHGDFTAEAMRPSDPANNELHTGQRTSSASSGSPPTYNPPAGEPRPVRTARGVRPPRPMTLPRSSGYTRT